jgi:hypothetical protein
MATWRNRALRRSRAESLDMEQLEGDSDSDSQGRDSGYGLQTADAFHPAEKPLGPASGPLARRAPTWRALRPLGAKPLVAPDLRHDL